MCDFAPRNTYDINKAILETAAAFAGCIIPRPVIAHSDTVMLIADETTFEKDLDAIVSDINNSPSAPAEATTTPGDSGLAEAHAPGVDGGEGGEA